MIPLVTTIASPDLDGERPLDDDRPRVVGGEEAPIDRYPATAAILYGDVARCTGVLVAPDVVLTAAHCLDAEGLTSVVLGTTDWNTDQGELREVVGAFQHPDYAPNPVLEGFSTGPDLAVLLLDAPSTVPPASLATDCLWRVIDDGSHVHVVGFGNTRTNGDGRTSVLHVAETLVRDVDCSEALVDDVLTGCDPTVRPNGELFAGGVIDVDGDGARDTRDSCSGDSGGPLYADTLYGEVVAGFTSRGILSAPSGRTCGDGGIYVRSDIDLDWVRDVAGVDVPEPVCNLAPDVEVSRVVVEAGREAVVAYTVSDVDSEGVVVEVVSRSAMGEVAVDGRAVVFLANREALGPTSFVLRFVDDGSNADDRPQSTEVEVQVDVVDRTCGCRTGPGSQGWLALTVLVAFRRARR